MKHLPAPFPLILFATGFLATATHAQNDGAPPAGSVLLQRGNPVEREIVGGQSHEYHLQLDAGQYLKLQLSERGLSISIACLGPDGQRQLGFRGEVIADASGTYRFVVAVSERQRRPGSYGIGIETLENATPAHHSRIAAARAYSEGLAAYRPLVREALLKTIAAFEESLKHWRAADDSAEASRTLSEMGMIYNQLGEEKKALDCGNQALSLARAARNREVEAAAVTTLGVVHNNFGDKKTAIEYFDQALLLMREVQDRTGEANTLNYLGRAHFRSGQNRKAVAYLHQALEVVREIQNRGLEAYVLGDIGSVYELLGDYQQSVDNHQQALLINRELKNSGAEAVTLNNLGLAYLGMGEYQKALDSYTASADLNRKLDPRGDRLAVSLQNVGVVYSRLGDRQRALHFFQQALDLQRVINNRSSLATILSAMGDVYGELRDSRKALQFHAEALSLRRASNDADGEAVSLTSLGTEYAKLGELEKARDSHERAVAIVRNSGNQSRLAGALRNLGTLNVETHEREKALAALSEALDISRTIRDRQGEANALAGLARLERDGGNLAKAHAWAGEALSAFESLRRTIVSPNLRASFFSSVRDVQELDVDVLMRLHAQRPNEGFGAAALLATERGRARSLLELLQESGTGIRRGVDTALISREHDLERRISAKADAQVRLLSRTHASAEADALARELTDLAAELDQVQSRIRAASPQYAALTQPAPLDLKQIQTKVLDSDTVLLEYSLGKEKSFLWSVGSSSVDIYELPPRAEIESAAKRVYELLTARNQRPAKETPLERAARVRRADQAYLVAATKASAILLGPAASRIEKKRLLIVGEGVLQYLPFAALPEPRADGPVSPNPSPLIANHEIVTAPSASVLSVLRQETAGRSPAPKTLAVFADPVFAAGDARIAQQASAPAAALLDDNDSDEALRSAADLGVQEFLRLRFSRTEAEEISRLAPSESIRKALDFEASRDAVLQPELGQYRIVHFATHSLLNNEHPELSGVVFSLVDRSGRRQNGFLRLYDIYNLRLGSDLVVLSACRTALGSEIRGEGLIGLTRGFLYAGAPRVVATLWEIDDRATAGLMKSFYQGMLARAERPAQALRNAQLAMWKARGWDAPYYWAAFTLQGEWR